MFVLAFAGRADAHQGDTSYTEIDITPQSLSTAVSLDLQTLARWLDLDADRDGQITRAELLARADTIQSYLAQHLHLSLDDGKPDLGEARPPEWPAGGEARAEAEWPLTIVTFHFARALESLPKLMSLDYDVWSELGAHTNLTQIREPGQPPFEIVFTEDEPDFDYFLGMNPSWLERTQRFVGLGAERALFGLDHLLFFAALLLASRRGDVLKVVTAFSLGYSLTLSSSALGVMQLPSPWVSIGIAASLIWVATENLLRRYGRHRWVLAFGFGLVHGFGFANALRGLDVPAGGVASSLAGFNVGVELGQIAFALLLLPCASLLARSRIGPTARARVSLAIGIAALAWLVGRALHVPFAPA